MSELLPSVAALAEKVESRKALYFFAAAIAFGVFVIIIIQNKDQTINAEYTVRK